MLCSIDTELYIIPTSLSGCKCGSSGNSTSTFHSVAGPGII